MSGGCRVLPEKRHASIAGADVDAFLARNHAHNPEFIVDTDIASIWKVQTTSGAAALKIYPDAGMSNEAPGFGMLRHWDGCGAARLIDLSGRCVLLEWLDGPSLGDRFRAGAVEFADAELGRVAQRLHASDPVAKTELPPLESWLDALFDLKPTSEAAPADWALIERAKVLGRELLATATHRTALHGDLHHDNVREGKRGFCAFDAKGVYGDLGYEMANAFRNPGDLREVPADAATFHRRAEMWSGALCVPEIRLKRWAAVKSGLSVAWRSKGGFRSSPEIRFLRLFLSESGCG